MFRCQRNSYLTDGLRFAEEFLGALVQDQRPVTQFSAVIDSSRVRALHEARSGGRMCVRVDSHRVLLPRRQRIFFRGVFGRDDNGWLRFAEGIDLGERSKR